MSHVNSAAREYLGRELNRVSEVPELRILIYTHNPTTN